MAESIFDFKKIQWGILTPIFLVASLGMVGIVYSGRDVSRNITVPQSNTPQRREYDSKQQEPYNIPPRFNAPENDQNYFNPRDNYRNNLDSSDLLIA